MYFFDFFEAIKLMLQTALWAIAVAAAWNAFEMFTAWRKNEQRARDNGERG